MKKPWLWLAISLFSVAPAAQAFQVQMDVTITDIPTPVIHVMTNLPDGVVLHAGLRSPEAGWGSLKAFSAPVHDGEYTAGPFNNDHHPLPPGKYIIEVGSVANELPQDAKGPLVTSDPAFGPIIKYRSTFVIPEQR